MVSKSRRLQLGATIVHWLLALIPLMLIGAFAFDLNNLYVTLAELQKAADAGALEGARLLYCPAPDGTLNYPGKQCVDASGNCQIGPDGVCLKDAVAAASDAAQTNYSQGAPVEVITTKTETGHWTFKGTGFQDSNGVERGGVFTANDNHITAPLVDPSGQFRPLVKTSLPEPAVYDCSSQAPDSNCTSSASCTDVNRDACDIDSVRVCVERNATPVLTFFTKLIGLPPFKPSVCAVAYVGFAGTIQPGKIDWPIAMCYTAVMNGCRAGTMIPSGSNTAAWTNYGQPCDAPAVSDGQSAGGMGQVINSCSDAGNTVPLYTGEPMQANGGMLNNTFGVTYGCWSSYSFNVPPQFGHGTWTGLLSQLNVNDPYGYNQPTTPWKVRLPVIDCPMNNAGANCGNTALIGAVEVNILWITDQSTYHDPDTYAPHAMSKALPDGSTLTWSGNVASDTPCQICNNGSCNPCPSDLQLHVDPTDGISRWNSFVAAFGIRGPTGSPPPWPTTGNASRLLSRAGLCIAEPIGRHWWSKLWNPFECPGTGLLEQQRTCWDGTRMRECAAGGKLPPDQQLKEK